MIILITGRKGSGKDTLADIIAKLLEHDNVKRLSFAEPIKQVSKILFGWDYEAFNQEDKEDVDVHFGVSPRGFWQWFGTEVMQFAFSAQFKSVEHKIGRNIWAKVLADSACDPSTTYIVSDWRFTHELEYLLYNSSHTVVAVRVDRDSADKTDTHESETEVDNLIPNYSIENNGTLEELEELAKTMLEAIKNKYHV